MGHLTLATRPVGRRPKTNGRLSRGVCYPEGITLRNWLPGKSARDEDNRVWHKMQEPGQRNTSSFRVRLSIDVGVAEPGGRECKLEHCHALQ
jgi:hypothetical protein